HGAPTDDHEYQAGRPRDSEMGPLLQGKRAGERYLFEQAMMVSGARAPTRPTSADSCARGRCDAYEIFEARRLSHTANVVSLNERRRAGARESWPKGIDIPSAALVWKGWSRHETHVQERSSSRHSGDRSTGLEIGGGFGIAELLVLVLILAIVVPVIII